QGWPQPGRQTEYDLQLSLLRNRNITAVDLRPVLRGARVHGDTYLQHDTHWNASGALAAFNAIAAEAGLAGWRLDPANAIGPETEIQGGDLARMLGNATYVSEIDRPLKLGGFQRVDHSTTPPVYELASETRKGPVIVILGDSFTISYFAPMIAANGGRAIWLHHQWCGFDWKWIEKFQPDQVCICRRNATFRAILKGIRLGCLQWRILRTTRQSSPHDCEPTSILRMWPITFAF
ncbi:MAG TPA: hypothetical protein VEK14_04920, partial [Rhodomicrobium sp.]|nr:hypothetical protein [Rhodomicrobium sp.]